MKIVFLIHILFFYVTSCVPNESNPQKAAKEFCDCLVDKKNLGKNSALEYCNKLISTKYELYRIYHETRDKNINELYDKKMVKYVLNFIYEFTSAVDKIGPPFWFLKKNEPIY